MSVNGATSRKVKKGEKNDESEMGRDYDAETRKAMNEIDACQEALDELNGMASEEILKVEQKYNRLRKPHYDKRQEIISKIPNFWMTALMNHPHISSIIDNEEEECLIYLSKIEVEESEDIKSGYRIKFCFNENPFFDNKVLTKEHHLGVASKPSSCSTLVQWKEGQDLIAKAKWKQDSKKGRKRMMVPKSFFSWFLDNTSPTNDDIADVIKDDIWPNPLQYYLLSETQDEGEIENNENGENDSDEEVEEEEFEDEDMGEEDGEEVLVEEETEVEEEVGDDGGGGGNENE